MAVRWGLLPGIEEDYLAMSEAARQHRLEEARCRGEAADMLELAWFEAGGQRIVKGTRNMLFPAERPPVHKYAALFDSRPCFDALRHCFLIPTVAAAASRARDVHEACHTLSVPAALRLCD